MCIILYVLQIFPGKDWDCVAVFELSFVSEWNLLISLMFETQKKEPDSRKLEFMYISPCIWFLHK
jgi:hypothetical protein